MRAGSVILLGSLLGKLMAADFEPPGPEVRSKAIGSLDGLPTALRRALTADADFEPVPKPGPHDWLGVHSEPGQTFEKFKSSGPNRPTATRRSIYLQPLGDFSAEQSPPLEKLRQFATAFFQMEVKLQPVIQPAVEQFTTRTNQFTRKRQILTGNVLKFLSRRLPDDAFCVLAITMEDLYPAESWNFVFGEASSRDRVAVYSFARYDPAFYGSQRTKDYPALLRRRSCRVLAHETGHMFGLQHCIYFHCLMNGSNHLDESDRRPMHLCPVCLRKLQFVTGFDVVKHYEALAEFYNSESFDDEARWTRGRLEKIKGETAK
jgi:archaemetzincin